MSEIAKMYGEVQLAHIQHDFAVAQARLREQEMLTLSFKEGYNIMHQRLTKAFENYQVLSTQITVGTSTLFVKTVP